MALFNNPWQQLVATPSPLGGLAQGIESGFNMIQQIRQSQLERDRLEASKLQARLQAEIDAKKLAMEIERAKQESELNPLRKQALEQQIKERGLSITSEEDKQLREKAKLDSLKNLDDKFKKKEISQEEYEIEANSINNNLPKYLEQKRMEAFEKDKFDKTFNLSKSKFEFEKKQAEKDYTLTLQKMAQDALTQAKELNKKSFGQEQDLRKEYTNLSKTFIDVRDAYSRIKSAEQTASGDLALIFSFMKMLDPGSVVREGEFATAQNAAGIPDRIRNSYNRALNGERLNPNQRESFMNQAASTFSKARSDHEALRKQFGTIAEKNGLDKESILLEFKSSEKTPAIDTKENQDIFNSVGGR